MPTRQRRLVEFSLLIGLVAAIASRTSSAHSADWPQFMRSAEHTGDAAQEALPVPLELAVCVQLDDARACTTPIAANGRLFFSPNVNNTLYCFEPESDQRKLK